jgi:hypothetical protein
MKMPTLPKSVTKVANRVGAALEISSLNQLLVVLIAIFVLRRTISLYTPMDMVVLIVLFIIGKTLNLAILLSFAWAVIITGLYMLIVKPTYVKVTAKEGFDNMANTEAKKPAKTRKNGARRTKSTKKAKNDKGQDITMDFQEDDAKETFQLDKDRTEQTILKSLDKKEIKGLTTDTQELINTQKQLMELLNQMGPALKDGKEILNTFQNYFGNDKDLRGSQ